MKITTYLDNKSFSCLFFILAENSCCSCSSPSYFKDLKLSWKVFWSTYFFVVWNFWQFSHKNQATLLLGILKKILCFENIVFIPHFRKNPPKKVLNYSSSPCWLLLTGAPHFSTLHTTTTTTLLSKIASCLLLQLTSKSLLCFALLPK